MKLASDQAGSKGSHENDVSDFSLFLIFYLFLQSVGLIVSSCRWALLWCQERCLNGNSRPIQSHCATPVEREHLSFHAQKWEKDLPWHCTPGRQIPCALRDLTYSKGGGRIEWQLSVTHPYCLCHTSKHQSLFLLAWRLAWLLCKVIKKCMGSALRCIKTPVLLPFAWANFEARAPCCSPRVPQQV